MRDLMSLLAGGSPNQLGAPQGQPRPPVPPMPGMQRPPVMPPVAPMGGGLPFPAPGMLSQQPGIESLLNALAAPRSNEITPPPKKKKLMSTIGAIVLAHFTKKAPKPIAAPVAAATEPAPLSIRELMGKF